MRERIKQIMEEKGLRLSSYADKIGVSRPTISQILGENGRKNDPSMATISKILTTFPDISQAWLVNGEGPMYKRQIVQPPSTLFPTHGDLFSNKKAVEPLGKQPEREIPAKDEKKPENEDNPPPVLLPNINLSNNISKKIDKIMIFFSDKTYMTFISEE